MPKAELNIPSLLCCSSAKHIGLSWMIQTFQKLTGVFPPLGIHYVVCLHKQAKGAIHSRWGELDLSSRIFKPEAKNAWDVYWEKRKKKKKQRDKRSQNLSGWLRSTIDNLQGSILPLPCTERGEQLQFSGFERAHLSLPRRERSVSGLHIPHQNPGWLLAAPSSSPPAKERSRSPGEHTFLRVGMMVQKFLYGSRWPAVPKKGAWSGLRGLFQVTLKSCF